MITVGVNWPMTSGFSSGLSRSAMASASSSLTCGAVGGHLALDASAQVVEQELGGLHAGVGHQQRGLELFIERIVDLRVDEHGLDAGAGLAQAGLELVEPALAFGGGGFGDGWGNWCAYRGLRNRRSAGQAQARVGDECGATNARVCRDRSRWCRRSDRGRNPLAA
jgi:hypothetical protein